MAAAKTAYPFARRMDANVLSIGIWGTLKPKISPCCGGGHIPASGAYVAKWA